MTTVKDDEDVAAARRVLERIGMSGDINLIAEQVALSCRVASWGMKQADIDRLETEVRLLRSHLSGGMCPHCGQLLGH